MIHDNQEVPPSPGNLRQDAGRSPGRTIPPKLYRVGEVVEYSGYSRQTIHNYTIIGLLRESGWTKGGHRLYDEGVFWRLDQIARMKQQNKSLQEIRRQLARLDGASGQTDGAVEGAGQAVV